MSFLFSLACAIAAPVMAWRLWRELEDREEAALLSWFSLWLGKGVLLPLAAWEFVEWLWLGSAQAAAKAAAAAALAAGLPTRTFLPTLARTDAVPDWWPASTPEALLLALAAWAAVNFLWTACAALRRVTHCADVWITGGSTGLIFLPVALLIGFALGVPGLFWGSAFWFAGLAYVFTNYTEGPPGGKEPSYSSAVGLLKFGRFEQAEKAIIAQLEEAEDDYTGWMMLAELYALHFRDLPTADRTVHDLCAQPNVNASQVSAALHKLADWYLVVDENPAAARSVLEEVELQYPNTHLAHMTHQRLRRLPASRAELQASKQASTIRLRPGAAAVAGFAPLTTSDAEFATRRAEQLADKLASNPGDARIQEELARLLEGPLKRPTEGMDHLRQLLLLRGFSKEQRGEWLNLLATWQLRHQRDAVDGRKTLDQVVRDHAGTEAADQAAKRLQMLAIEDRFRPAPPTTAAPRKPGPIRVEVPKPRRPGEPQELSPPKWD